MTDAVILVGGLGKRLGKITKKTPKPLIKIGSKTFLDILISKIIKFNFEHIYLMCSYKKEKFFKLYHNKKIHNSKIKCIDEGAQKDTGGGLIKLKKKIKKNFYLFNGDSYFDVDLNMLKRFKNKSTIGKIAFTTNKDYKKNIKLNNMIINNRDLLFFSKKKTNLMNGGIYYFHKKIFKFLSNKKISIENDIINKLIIEKKIEGKIVKANFIDIGTPQKLNFIKKNQNFLKEKAFFLDRDGVINRLNENGYIKNKKEFFLLQGVGKSINYLNRLNFRVIVISNQACIGKGIISEKKLISIHEYMKFILRKKFKAIIDDIFYSPYYRFSKKRKYRLNKKDRKPHIGLFKKAIEKWNIDINKSFFIGDSKTDKRASEKLNLKFYYKNKGSLYNQIKNYEKNYSKTFFRN